MIVILDCGSQLTHNIARRIRENKVYCEIIPFNKEFDKKNVDGIIISGSPASVHDKNAPFYSEKILNLNIPILGICYGMQSLTQILDGMVEHSDKREYGQMKITTTLHELFKKVPSKNNVWMSHGDRVLKVPDGFEIIAKSAGGHIAAMASDTRRIYAVQFHPEVDHTEYGRQVLSNFLEICKCKKDWTSGSFITDTINSIKKTVGNKKVIGGVSGGVDSTVGGALMQKAIGDNFIPVFIDNGLLRKHEGANVKEAYEKYVGKLNYVDASDKFISGLSGVIDPEKKRKIIGKEFINIFEEEAKKHGAIDFLMQGTLYPDVIESVSVFGGPTSTIKSHHNVGGLPEKMKLKLVEPLKYLFKDEVREVGEELGLPKSLVWRHPFPGPGLAIRIIGEITKQKLSILREADKIFTKELINNKQYDKVWQAGVVLTSNKSVGVMGDERTYEYVAALFAVTSNDGMTVDWSHLPYDMLAKISNRIINEVKGINRVVYNITSKPPGTIEWE